MQGKARFGTSVLLLWVGHGPLCRVILQPSAMQQLHDCAEVQFFKVILEVLPESSARSRFYHPPNDSAR